MSSSLHQFWEKETYKDLKFIYFDFQSFHYKCSFISGCPYCYPAKPSWCLVHLFWLWQILTPNQELLHKWLLLHYRKYIGELKFLFSALYENIFSWNKIWRPLRFGLCCVQNRPHSLANGLFQKGLWWIFEVRRTFCEKWELGQRMELYQLAQCALGVLLIDSVPHCTLGLHFVASSWIGTYRKYKLTLS